jgi:hypothetical protein
MTLEKSSLVGYFIAVVLGLALGILDTAAPFGDDMAMFTLLLLVLTSGLLGFVQPKKPWLSGILVGVGLPLVALAAHALGLSHHNPPNTYATLLPLIPVSLAVCVIATCCGAFARRVLFS